MNKTKEKRDKNALNVSSSAIKGIVYWFEINCVSHAQLIAILAVLCL